MTFLIIGITVLFSYLAFNNPGLKDQYMLNPYLVNSKKQYYRIFSHAFIHADWSHLIFNMFTLYFFGSSMFEGELYGVEADFKIIYGKTGMLFYVLLYVGGFLFASLPALVKHKNNPGYNSLGASGAVSAVLFASILINPYNGIYIFLLPVEIPAIIFGAGYLLYSAYMAKRNTDNIAHDAHFWGAIFGFVFPAALEPRLIEHFFDALKHYSI